MTAGAYNRCVKRQAVPSVRGTRDFYPPEMAFRKWLHGTARSVSERFGYAEYEGPILETVDLYTAKSGEELVKEQAFTLTDKGGDLLALRPELTPTLARMVAARAQELAKPIRWFSYGPFWRYERPQKGRGREFFQWNVDCVGSNSPACDAEAVAIAASFFAAAGLLPTEVRILVNDRRLMEGEIARLGIDPARKKDLFRLIDRKDKMPAEKWRAHAAEIGLSGAADPLEALLADTELWRRSESLTGLFASARELGFVDWIRFDPSVIRGLDYYTGIVFEARDASGEFRAILGGGRYDNLVADVGGDPLSGVGFAMGDMVVELVLSHYGKTPKLGGSAARVLVTVFGPDGLAPAAAAARKFREAGVPAALYPEPAKLEKQLKYADALGIPFAAIIGPDEAAAGKVAVKDLARKSQETLSWGEATERVRARG